MIKTGSFTLDIRNFVEKTKKNNETVMRAVTLKLFSAIIKASPVDTGRFRMNWIASGALPALVTRKGFDKTGEKAVADATRHVMSTPAWTELTLSNNLPYGQLLEFGGYSSGHHGPERPNASNLVSFVGPHKFSSFVGPKRRGYVSKTVNGYSKQAPQGMVRINIARFNTLLAEEAAKVR